MFYIYVDRTAVANNFSQGRNSPPIMIRKDGPLGPITLAYSVEIAGPSKVVYSPDAPLPDGTHVWIETTSPIVARTTE